MAIFRRSRRDDTQPDDSAQLAAAVALAPRTTRGVTAAATKIDFTDDDVARREAAQHRKRPFKWQKDAWQHYDDVELVRNYGRWAGDVQQRMRLFPAYIADPDEPPMPADKAEGVPASEVRLAYDIFDRFRSDEEDLSELQRVSGLNLAIPGEVWWVGTDDQPEYATRSNPTGERWRAVSVEELVVTRDGRWAISPDEFARESEMEFLDPETTTLVRMYRRHGRRRRWPDSAMRSANLICEELLIATESLMGTLRARLSAGMLPIPDDIEASSIGGAHDTDDDDEERDDGKDVLLERLMKHMMTPIRDHRSAAAVVPYLLRVPNEYLDKIKLVDLARDIDPKLIERMEHLISRFAIAIDMPPEQLTGKSDLNHWNIYELDAEGIRMHAEPVTGIYVNGLVSKVWRPRLEMGGVSDPERWTISWDPSEAMAHPDLSGNAMKGYAANPPVIGRIPTAKALGFSEDDMPDDEELTQILEYRRSTRRTDQPGASQAGQDTQVTLPEPGDRPSEGSADPMPAGGMQASGRPRVDLGRGWARIEARLTRDLLVEADGGLRRMVERAASRVKTAASRRGSGAASADIRAIAQSVTVERLPAALSSDQFASLALSDEDLWAGGLGTLAAHWRAWTARARAEALEQLRRAGAELDPDLVDDYEINATVNSDEGWHVLEAGLAAAAALILFAPSTPGPPLEGEADDTLTASPRVVKDALTAAGGGPAPDGGPGGLLAGKDWDAFLDATPAFEKTGWVWEVGAPVRPFEPHQQLDGVEFAGWFDEQLAAQPDEFPFVSFYAPQDHDGCQCTAVPNGVVSQLEGIGGEG